MKKYYIGVDISKEKLDICVMKDEKIVRENIVKNTIKDMTAYINTLVNKGMPLEEILVCAEYTGQYGYPMCCACEATGVDVWMEDPLQIKQSSGAKRGKDDKTDARKIAEYAKRFESKCRLYRLPEKNLATLRQLISERDMYVTNRAAYTAQLTDQQRFMSSEDYAKKSKRMSKIIKAMDKAIDDIDKQISKLVDGDETISRQVELLKSIDGVGERTALKMIVVTNAFTQIHTARQFCCYAGVAPFEYMSGSSVRSRKRVSQRADKSIKSLLHMCALAATHSPGELNDYYLRKVEEGKNKMSIINAIRSKIVLRMYAVIKRNEPYKKIYQNSLV